MHEDETIHVLDGQAAILFIVTPGHLDEFFRLKDTVSTHDEFVELVQQFF